MANTAVLRLEDPLDTSIRDDLPQMSSALSSPGRAVSNIAIEESNTISNPDFASRVANAHKNRYENLSPVLLKEPARGSNIQIKTMT